MTGCGEFRKQWARKTATKAYWRVVERIKNLIESGALRPGDCLLSERELVEKLEVSRNSVREALKVLEVFGLIEIVPGQGAFVTRTTSNEAEIFATILTIQNRNLRHVLEVRLVVEVGAAELACRRRSDEDLQNMVGILENMEKATLLETRSQLDLEFHVAIVNATHNPLLSRVMKVVSYALQDQMPVILKKLHRSPGSVLRILEEHWRIYRAIENRSHNVARKEVEDHLRDLKAIIDEDDVDGGSEAWTK